MGTTTDKLQKLIEKKKDLVDSVNSKAGTNFSINCDLCDIAETIKNIEGGGGITPTGTLSINKNGTHNVSSYEKVSVNVSIPDGYIQPTGTLSITENNSYDVSSYANVEVNVPNVIPEGYVQPTGTLDIDSNGEHNVSNYEKVNVNVSGGSGDIPFNIQKNLNTTKNASWLFSGYQGESLDNYLNNLSFSNVNNIYCMFYNNINLKTIPLFDTSAITDFRYMCNGCSSLENIFDIDLTSCEKFGYVFKGCSSLKEIKIINTPTIATIDRTEAFSNCSSIKLIDMDYFGSNSTAYSGKMFYNCSSLKALVIRKINSSYNIINTDTFTGSGIESGIGFVYVPRTNYTTFTSDTTSTWFNISSKLRVLEDYTIDGKITGELDLAKMGISE